MRYTITNGMELIRAIMKYKRETKKKGRVERNKRAEAGVGCVISPNYMKKLVEWKPRSNSEKMDG